MGDDASSGRRRALVGSPYPPEAENALRLQAKAELRKRLRAIRRALPREAREARSAAIADRLRREPRAMAARTVLAYAPMRGEVDPTPVMEAAWARGARVALPWLDLLGEDLELRAYGPGDVLEESGRGFLQPAVNAAVIEPGEVDLALVPALAVDDRGRRLGYGGGFYDRLLPRMPQAFRVAVIFDFQLLAEVPVTPGDVPVDHVVTDRQDFAPAPGDHRDPDPPGPSET